MNNSTQINHYGQDKYPRDKTIVDLFDEQVIKTPDHIAVVFENTTLTYQELYEKSNQLAHYLRAFGVREETLVPICINRSLEMIIGIMGILKAGGAYVPIDPEYPMDRIQYMLKDTASKLVVTHSSCNNLLKKDEKIVESVCLDTNWHSIARQPTESVPTKLHGSNLAYIIYTSGSTGRPKGVMIEHESLLSYLINSKTKYLNADEDSAGNYFHLSYTFDGSITGLLMPLAWGKSIVLAPLQPGDPFRNDFLEKQSPYDFIKLTPAHMQLLETAIDSRADKITKRLVLGGEALQWSHINFLVNSKSDVEIINEYGPTEATVGCCIYSFNTSSVDDMLKAASIPIGKPINNVSLYIVDENRERVPIGVIGELCIGGVQLARGYLNQPELTAEKFVSDPFIGKPGARMYCTGDLVRWQSDGNIEYIGRMDDQVKIRGYRIELGEIENILQQADDVKQCVVLAREDKVGDKRLIGYVVTEGSFNKEHIIRHLQSKLPEYMVPRLLMQLDKMPLTVNGKIDKKSLPDPDASELITNKYVAPENETEERITTLWKELLNVNKVGVQDNFFELGGNSILALKTTAVLKQLFNYELPVTKIYQYPTVAGIASHINRGKKAITKTVKKNRSNNNLAGDIAVVGMAARFPGANTIEELWTLLKEGRESISFFKQNEIDPYVPDEEKNDPDYVRARGIVETAKEFDASFFGINTKLAELMDPQQRIFLEVAWEALERTGYLPAIYMGSIGVFAGAGNNTYYLNNVLSNKQLISKVGSFQVMALNEKDYIASRTAYELNLRGPAVSLYSACSTSLLAIAQAVESLRNGYCDIALAGGASITSPIKSGHIYQEGAILSRDGHSRAFDADAGGTVFSDGAAVVLLKNKEEAERDGDIIYAVIKGVGVNNDGGGKGSFTAPSAEGQAGAITMALADAQINAASITYIEAHGTATPLGDPIEIEGLNMAFGNQEKKQYCAIGTIKSNMGHLTAAAGVAGFIKATLSLYYRQIPPSIHYSRPNPEIDFANSPFFVNTVLKNWDVTDKRRAGVSSFGVGGTNVHIVLEEFENKEKESSAGRPAHLINWSAKTTKSNNDYAAKLVDYLQTNAMTNLADIAYTLQTSREEFSHRRFIIAANHDELEKKLIAAPLVSDFEIVKEHCHEIIFTFPGQGSQYLNMGLELYKHEPIFRQAIDECAGLLKDIMGEDIRHIIYPDNSDAEAEEKINNTYYTQPALFVIEYAVAKLWMSWNLQPTAFIGHSIGEFVAAHLAGIFSLEDALLLIAARGRLMSALPGGSMLSIRTDYKRIESLLPQDLSLAALNSPGLLVVAGPTNKIINFSKLLESKEIFNKLLHTSHAFHSSMMDPIVEPFEEIVRGIRLNIPGIPIVSTVTGDWMTDANATDPAYWAGHLRSTVRFSDAVVMLLNEGQHKLVLETGPRNVTATLVRQHAIKKPVTVVSTLDVTEGQSEYYSLLKAIGQLWLHGITFNWNAFYSGEKRIKLTLPTYAFDRKLFWVSPAITSPANLLATELSSNIPQINNYQINNTETQPENGMRKATLIDRLKKILEDASGIEMGNVTAEMSFIEIGLDSLLLTQIAFTLKNTFNIPLTFRQLNEEFGTLGLLANYIDSKLPDDPAIQEVITTFPHQSQQHIQSIPSPISSETFTTENNLAIESINRQLQMLTRQIAMLQGNIVANDSINSQNIINPLPNENNTGENIIAKNQQDIDTKVDSQSKTEQIIKTFEESLTELKDVEFTPDREYKVQKKEEIASKFFSNIPPMPNARLGKDKDGNPAWFIMDEKNPGKYFQIN